MASAELKLEPTLCHGLVEAIVASLRSQAERQGVKLVVAKDTEDIVARTDRKVLSTIVISLLSHAIGSALRGVVHVSVTRCMAEGRQAVEISIAALAGDGGAPVPGGRPSELGRGPGLAAQLGGKVSIYCKAGEGSTYVLQVPEN